MVMVTRADFELRRQQWARLNRWEREEPRPELTPEQCLAALGALYELLPESTRFEDRDPERQGVRRMHELLRLLSS